MARVPRRAARRRSPLADPPDGDLRSARRRGTPVLVRRAAAPCAHLPRPAAADRGACGGVWRGGVLNLLAAVMLRPALTVAFVIAAAAMLEPANTRAQAQAVRTVPF